MLLNGFTPEDGANVDMSVWLNLLLLEKYVPRPQVYFVYKSISKQRPNSCKELMSQSMVHCSSVIISCSADGVHAVMAFERLEFSVSDVTNKQFWEPVPQRDSLAERPGTSQGEGMFTELDSNSVSLH